MAQSYFEHLADQECAEKAQAIKPTVKQNSENGTERKNFKINLCDPSLEPSDEALARMMDCVAQEANKSNEKAAQMLNTEIDREIAKAIKRIA